MPGQQQDPEIERMVASLDKRLRRLELKYLPVIDARHVPVLFSFAGPLVDDAESPAFEPIVPLELVLLRPRVLTAPSGGDLTIDLKLSGAFVRTLTISDGDFYVDDAEPLTVPAGDWLTATTTGTFGAADLAIAAVPNLL